MLYCLAPANARQQKITSPTSKPLWASLKKNDILIIIFTK